MSWHKWLLKIIPAVKSWIYTDTYKQKNNKTQLKQWQHRQLIVRLQKI